MRMLLDGGIGTVEDQYKVKCVWVGEWEVVPLLFLVCLVMGQCIHSSESLVVFAPMIGGNDSPVVGILQRSPASGERVGERVQSRSVSEEQGTSYTLSHALVTMHIFCQSMACMHKHVVIHTT